MSLRALFGGASKCRTIDVCDIFGDNSGVALYRLDGNANDESGNYHGTEAGTITYGGGAYERGLSCTGVAANHISTTLMLSNSAYTLSAWIKPNASTSELAILANTYTAADRGFFLRKRATTEKLSFVLNNGSTSFVYDSIATLTTSLTHVLITWDGTTTANGLKLYINGSLDSQHTAGTTAATIGTWTRGIYIGVEPPSPFYVPFNGSIDQVRILNRAITATEVATLYAECAPTSIVDNINPFEDGSLKALYKFNGDATDATGTYNGTATNVTYGTGKFGQCAVFNGSSSKIDATTSMLSYIQNAEIITESVWFKTSLTTIEAISSFRNAQAWETKLILTLNTSVAGDIGIISASTSASLVLGTFNGGYNDNNFHHAVATINYITKEFRVYVDGILRITGTNTNIRAYNTFNIAQVYHGVNGAIQWFNGSIDQVRIFNKALTPMEVASLYNETTPLEEPMHSLVDPFKDGSGKALYRLEGNALDESGNYNGTPTSVTYGAGRFGRAGIFASGVNINTSTVFGLTSGAVATFSVWAKVTTMTDNFVFGNYSSAAFTGMYIYIAADGRCAIQQNVSSGNFKRVELPAGTITVNTYYHIVGIILANGNIEIYINGVKPSQTIVTTGTVTSNTLGASTYYIGKYANGGLFNGQIDQVRIFNRALTAGEVSQLYTEI